MLLILWKSIALLALLAGTPFAQATGQSFEIGSAGPPREEIPYGLRKDLQCNGIRLLRTVNGVDFTLAELWSVRSLNVRSSSKSPNGVAYGQLAPGQSLAVLYLPAPILDARLQAVPSGYYVLRYVVIDQDDGDHKMDGDTEGIHGLGEYRDYVYLDRMKSSKEAVTGPATQKSLELSRKGLRDKSTGLLALPPLNPTYTMFPYVVSDDLGNCAVQFKLPVQLSSGQASEMGIRILLVNPPNFSEED